MEKCILQSISEDNELDNKELRKVCSNLYSKANEQCLQWLEGVDRNKF
jgi:replication initiation and membrane attachment protein DnaB